VCFDLSLLLCLRFFLRLCFDLDSSSFVLVGSLGSVLDEDVVAFVFELGVVVRAVVDGL